MRVVSGQEMGLALAAALGISTEGVTKIVIEAGVCGPATVHVTSFANGERMDKVMQSLSLYSLSPFAMPLASPVVESEEESA